MERQQVWEAYKAAVDLAREARDAAVKPAWEAYKAAVKKERQGGEVE